VATRLIVIVVFTLDVTVEDFILVDNVADMSQLLGLSGELERDLELRRVEGVSCMGRGEKEGEDNLSRSNC